MIRKIVRNIELRKVNGGDGPQCYAEGKGPNQAYWQNTSPEAREQQQMKRSIEQYNAFYDRYTGAIEALNGIGGGAAVARGAKPSTVGF
jgi:hypothetical protein